jgi:hypothetical protein
VILALHLVVRMLRILLLFLYTPCLLLTSPIFFHNYAQNRFLERLVRGAESSDVIPESGNSSSSSSTSNIASGTVPTRNSSMLWNGAIAPLWAQKAAAAVLMEAAREELEKVCIHMYLS